MDDRSGGPFSSLFQQFINLRAISLFYSPAIISNLSRYFPADSIAWSGEHGASRIEITDLVHIENLNHPRPVSFVLGAR